MAFSKRVDNVLELIGNTPMVRLNRMGQPFSGQLYAKLEGANPGHSTKDRIALHIIEQAEREGRLKPGATIIETTSGNTGFSLAMVAAVKGYKCICAVTSRTSKDKIMFLRTLGAQVHICPAEVAADHPESYYSVGRRLGKEVPNSLYINQYFNELNIDAHFRSTGPEIWKQTEGKITHLIACSGTGGTISGAGRFLKSQNPKVQIIGVDAYGSILKTYHETGEINKDDIFPYRIEGVGKNLIPSATDFSVIDRFVKASDESSALRTREIAQKEGLMVGYSSGAAMEVFLKIREELPANSFVVILFPDHGSRYMSKVFSDLWMKEQGFLQKSSKSNAAPVSSLSS